ncbi:energy transducer TonB [Luteimonas sp. RD2P54]|uniref:Protein TonB n=1 Tax=Luteimonas endophytica TaxID=3042023 RepID=A0ABT6J3V2_9GAMM|nr:energy transducer TonB [Luteimonas endophytica]MDH5821499.1 energy transducer TonB [Luteimonas endophytica]
MSDPMNRPAEPRPAPPPSDRPPSDQPPPGERKSASPLLWLLLLIALLAVGWYFYSQRGAVDPPAEPADPVGEPADIGDGTPPPPASEREQAARPADPAPAPAPAITRPADPLERVEPEYPAAALRAQEEGTVLLRVQVDAGGNPGAIEIARSSRSRELDRAARTAVGQWRFSPAMENGQPVASTVEVPIDFRMDTQ